MSRFVRPQTKTLTLANGDQLIVRERLTAGEQRAYLARLYTRGPDGRHQFNPLMGEMAVVLSYLLDWNFRDDADQAVVIRDLSPEDLQTVLDSLDTEAFQEDRAANDAHAAAMLAAREEKKTTLTGAPA